MAKENYICTTKCRHMGHLYKKGMVVSFTDKTVPRHNDGSIAHFVPASPSEPAPPLPKSTVTVDGKKK